MLSLRLFWGEQGDKYTAFKLIMTVDIFSSVLINHILAAQHISTKEIQINFGNNPGKANHNE